MLPHHSREKVTQQQYNCYYYTHHSLFQEGFNLIGLYSNSFSWCLYNTFPSHHLLRCPLWKCQLKFLSWSNKHSVKPCCMSFTSILFSFNSVSQLIIFTWHNESFITVCHSALYIMVFDGSLAIFQHILVIFTSCNKYLQLLTNFSRGQLIVG